MKNFDTFIGIDWSGAKAPIKTKSIAVASVEKESKNIKLHPKIRSRNAVAEFIGDLEKQNQRTLIGIDCNLGYADEIVKKQIGANATAQKLWAEVDAVNQHKANFFAGDFWTHEKYKDDFWLEGKKPEGFHMPQRQTEIICAENGYGRPESPFKMIGAKQVGKGGLAGMRLAHYLKQSYGEKVGIWPFDSKECLNKACVVIAEIYPRQFIMRAGYGTQKIRDANALSGVCDYFNAKPTRTEIITDHDTDALVSAAGLRSLCKECENIPDIIVDPLNMGESAKTIEGWIFGVGDKIY